MATALSPALVFIGQTAADAKLAAREAAAALGVRLRDAVELDEGSVTEALERAGDGVISITGDALRSDRVRQALAPHTAVLVDGDEPWPAGCEDASAAILPAAREGIVARALPGLQALPGSGLTLMWATTASGDYPVWIGSGAANRAPWPASGRRFVVTDDTVGPLYGEAVPGADTVISMPAGEEHKTLQTAETIWRQLVVHAATRADHVVAVGGGVVGDVAGFCASAYQRGIPVVHVPTTLVAQVDSAYGGKTGVDLPEGKNYVGAYHQPAGVLVDPDTLRTLPAAERAAGYAEVLKTALIAGGPLWDRVAAGAEVDEAIIRACARTKLRVVAADERDAGRRQLLNLGHTVGHAIETSTGYARYRHGEAVGLGLLAALRLSGQDDLREHVRGLLSAAGLPVHLEGADPEAVVAATARDKKRMGESVPFVLVGAPGDVRHGEPVAGPDLVAAVRELIA